MSGTKTGEDPDFVERALRYLDGALDQQEVDALGAELIEDAQKRMILRDLVRQSQLAHELQVSAAPVSLPAAAATPITNSPARSFPLTLVAAAAAVVLVSAAILWRTGDGGGSKPNDVPDPSGVAKTETDLEAPSWKEIYGSPFNYPDFALRAELADDDSSPGVELAFLSADAGVAAPPAPTARDLSQLLAPIALLPPNNLLGKQLY